MAVPKNKSSKMRTRQRMANWKLAMPGMIKCSHCGEYTKPHMVCKACGYYDGKEIVKKEA